ncbi:hypothetical protein JOF58_006227 [Streptomyces cinnamonensis]|nr:hypothetical protein [Streptomyces virginiae]
MGAGPQGPAEGDRPGTPRVASRRGCRLRPVLLGRCPRPRASIAGGAASLPRGWRCGVGFGWCSGALPQAPRLNRRRGRFAPAGVAVWGRLRLVFWGSAPGPAPQSPAGPLRSRGGGGVGSASAGVLGLRPRPRASSAGGAASLPRGWRCGVGFGWCSGALPQAPRLKRRRGWWCGAVPRRSVSSARAVPRFTAVLGGARSSCGDTPPCPRPTAGSDRAPQTPHGSTGSLAEPARRVAAGTGRGVPAGRARNPRAQPRLLVTREPRRHPCPAPRPARTAPGSRPANRRRARKPSPAGD